MKEGIPPCLAGGLNSVDLQMDSTRQAMAVPTHNESYGLVDAFSGHEQVFSAPKSVPKKGGKKGFCSPPEKRKNDLTTFSEQKQQVFDELVAEFGDWFEETKQRFLSRLRDCSDSLSDGEKRKCWNCDSHSHMVRDCNQPRRKKRGKKKSRRVGVRERDTRIKNSQRHNGHRVRVVRVTPDKKVEL